MVKHPSALDDLSNFRIWKALVLELLGEVASLKQTISREQRR